MDLIKTNELTTEFESLLKNNNILIIKLLIETNAIPINIITDTIKKYYKKILS